MRAVANVYRPQSRHGGREGSVKPTPHLVMHNPKNPTEKLAAVNSASAKEGPTSPEIKSASTRRNANFPKLNLANLPKFHGKIHVYWNVYYSKKKYTVVTM